MSDETKTKAMADLKAIQEGLTEALEADTGQDGEERDVLCLTCCEAPVMKVTAGTGSWRGERLHGWWDESSRFVGGNLAEVYREIETAGMQCEKCLGVPDYARGAA